MLLALVEHRPIVLDYGRHPRARRAATGLVILRLGPGPDVRAGRHRAMGRPKPRGQTVGVGDTVAAPLPDL
jgi:hypothetical protein